MVSVSKIVLSISILLTILIALQFQDCKSFKTFPTKVTVSITNNLPNSLSVLVHCKDKHNDLGFITLQSNGVYNFTVKPTFLIPNKLYFCSFKWSSVLKYFNIYYQPRDQIDCDDECIWRIHDYGPCKVKKGNVIECFKWNTSPSVVEGGKLSAEGNNSPNV